MLCSVSKVFRMHEFIVPLETSFAHDHRGYSEFLTLAEISFPIAHVHPTPAPTISFPNHPFTATGWVAPPLLELYGTS